MKNHKLFFKKHCRWDKIVSALFLNLYIILFLHCGGEPPKATSVEIYCVDQVGNGVPDVAIVMDETSNFSDAAEGKCSFSFNSDSIQSQWIYPEIVKERYQFLGPDSVLIVPQQHIKYVFNFLRGHQFNITTKKSSGGKQEAFPNVEINYQDSLRCTTDSHGAGEFFEYGEFDSSITLTARVSRGQSETQSIKLKPGEFEHEIELVFNLTPVPQFPELIVRVFNVEHVALPGVSINEDWTLLGYTNENGEFSHKFGRNDWGKKKIVIRKIGYQTQERVLWLTEERARSRMSFTLQPNNVADK